MAWEQSTWHPFAVGRRPRILLVDDSVAPRRLLAEVLLRDGFEVSEASEGIEGLYKVRSTSFDMIITDIHMPAMDGLAFLRELRKLPQYERTPVIVLTSDVSANRIREMRDAGASAWLEKPPNLTSIAGLARSVIDRAS